MHPCAATALWAAQPESQRILTEAAFKVLRQQNGELMRAGTGMRGLHGPGQRRSTG
ncbi:protein of unknown function [Pseudomonas sp. JV551A1]|uniref:Uncharacterized protein n=1 Tax=Pseudomonas inefficax TaxID=2078786 RepID=A0AAQ1P8W2_9PSED|nr:protein of unknown function [Pseudomonas sp. JV551A1]SPO60646.1 protein of unknown function [Pseudomonas inefficax]